MRLIAERTHGPRKIESPTFDYITHTQEVRNQLQQFGMGPAVEFLTPEGLNRDRYILFARQRLMGPQYAKEIPASGLPEKLGEVAIPPTLKQGAPHIASLHISLNMGLGHLRPSLFLGHMVDVLGGTWENAFLAGEKDIFANRRGPDFNRVLRAANRQYRDASLQTAFHQGMLPNLPTFPDPDPLYTGITKALLLAADPIAYIKNPKKAIDNVLTVQDVHSPKQIQFQGQLLRSVFGNVMKKLVTSWEKAHPGKNLLLISTYPVVSRLIGHMSRRFREGFTSANFQPDAVQILHAFTHDPLTYHERREAAEKWGQRQGLPDGEIPNSVIMEGYVTPLSIFIRNELTQQRKQALQEGAPLTVVAPAGGVAPTQLGSFASFIEKGAQQMKNGQLNMIIQCGFEEGGGKYVYDRLHEVIQKNGVAQHVVLHVGKTPKAAADFLEAVSWSPMPLAFYVKGAEVARMAYAMNIPYIPTGAVGDHELWNIALFKDQPDIVTFLPDVSQQFQQEVQRVFPHDALIQRYPSYLPESLEFAKSRTVSSEGNVMDNVLQQIDAYIQSGVMTKIKQDAMLLMLDHMLQRKDHQTSRTPTRRKS